MGSGGDASVRVFGSLVVSVGQRKLVRFPTVRCVELLGFLFLRPGEFVSRTRLVESAWPDVDLKTGRARLSVSLHSCRKSFAAAEIDMDTFIQVDGQQLCALTDSVKNEWAEYWQAHRDAKMADNDQEKEIAINRMLEINRAPVLVDVREQWAEQARSDVAAAHQEASMWLANLEEAQGNSLKGKLLRERSQVDYGKD